jgi:2-deoxy-D-gluconate 3-dehydrogenase
MDININNFNMDFFSLKGKVALVTGGNVGLGQGFALALARAGADVFITDVTETYQETKELVEKEGRKFGYLKASVANRDDVNKTVEACVRDMGSLDILVNNAGIIRRNDLLECTDEDWKAVIDINLSGVYYMSMEAAKVMVKQGGGKIVNIASMLSFQGGIRVPSYAASKHGVAGVTKAFANELAAKNIQVNAIAPGYFATDNTAQIRADKARNDSILSRIPAARWGDPFDLLGGVVFLSSRASDYITGHILAIDGGWLVR